MSSNGKINLLEKKLINGCFSTKCALVPSRGQNNDAQIVMYCVLVETGFIALGKKEEKMSAGKTWNLSGFYSNNLLHETQ